MQLSEHPMEAFAQLLEASSDILVVTRQHPTDDSIGSLIAMGLVLEKLGKNVTLVTYGPVQHTLSFLSGFDRIANSVDLRGQFVISLDTSSAKVADLSYDFSNDGNMLRICVTPEEGMLDPEQLRCDVRKGVFDAIIVLDSPDFASLGPVYSSAQDVFLSVPIVNVDYHPGNALFGEVNVVDTSATSTAEVLVPLLEMLGGDTDVLDAQIATALLAGVIAGTRSFQRESTSSRAFTIAAQLVARGADQQRVVRSLFKNRSLAGMKLWGRLFSKVQYEESSRMAWTSASKKDFDAASARVQDLEGVDEELSLSLPNIGRTVVFFEDREGSVHARITCFEGDVLGVSRAFGVLPTGDVVEIVQEGATLQDLQDAVLSTLKTVPYTSSAVLSEASSS